MLLCAPSMTEAAAGRRANLFLIAGLSAVLLSAVPLRAVSAAQGEEIIHLDFDDGTLDGFETYMEGGECELRNEDGRLAVSITGCGSLDYANQAYRDGFSLDQNCTYNYSFDISCSIERQVEYRLQLNGGDYHAYLGEKIRIVTRREKGYIVIEVQDDGHGKKTRLQTQKSYKSVGTDNVRARLRLLCQGELEINKSTEGTVARIKIPEKK